MLTENDTLLSLLTVKIQDVESGSTLGSGIIYIDHGLRNKIYIITAAHVLFADGDDFACPFSEVDVAIYNPRLLDYQNIRVSADSWICSKDPDKDVAVIVLEKRNVEIITAELPEVLAVRERGDVTTFALKGFPQATLGIELDAIYPVWKQRMTSVNKFQLQLDADYTDYSTQGFSGNGIFLVENDQVYLFGIFTRFRSERNGKVIYAQYLATVNELLESHYQAGIRFRFLASDGITMDFFKNQIDTAIEDLGPRFSKKLNFKLPTARMFNDLTKDEVFKRKFLDIIHKWLVETRHYDRQQQNEHLAELATSLGLLRSKVRDWTALLKWDAGSLPIY